MLMSILGFETQVEHHVNTWERICKQFHFLGVERPRSVFQATHRDVMIYIEPCKWNFLLSTFLVPCLWDWACCQLLTVLTTIDSNQFWCYSLLLLYFDYEFFNHSKKLKFIITSNVTFAYYDYFLQSISIIKFYKI